MRDFKQRLGHFGTPAVLAIPLVATALLIGCSSDEPSDQAPTAETSERDRAAEAEAERRERAQLERRREARIRRAEARRARAERARVRRERADARRRRAQARQAELERERQEEQEASCHPSYDPCLDPNASDYDCEGGSGDGPSYTGQVAVTGYDEYDLDSDGDGTGCEP
jgi:hypothetical protein